MSRGDLGAAERAGGAGAEPDVDAGDVEGVAAQRQQAEPVVVRELAEADGAVERPGRLLLPLPASGGGGGPGQLGVGELRERVDGSLAEAAAAGSGAAGAAVVVRGEEEVLQLALPGAGAGVVALEEDAAQDVEQAGDEQHHGQDHRDEQHRRRDPRRRGGDGGGRRRPPPGRRGGGVHRRRGRWILQQRARHCNAASGTEEVHIGASATAPDFPRKKKPAAGSPQSRRHLGLPAGAPLAAGLGPWLGTSAAALIRCPAGVGSSYIDGGAMYQVRSSNQAPNRDKEAMANGQGRKQQASQPGTEALDGYMIYGARSRWYQLARRAQPGIWL